MCAHDMCGGKFGVGTAFFVGWLITLTFIPRVADLFGRLKLIKMHNIVHFIAYATLLYSTSYSMLITSMMLLGAMCTVRA